MSQVVVSFMHVTPGTARARGGGGGKIYRGSMLFGDNPLDVTANSRKSRGSLSLSSAICRAHHMNGNHVSVYILAAVFVLLIVVTLLIMR